VASYWLFQFNSDQSDTLGAIAAGQLTFTTKQNHKDIHVGDGVVIWRSKKDSGIYAIAEVASEPRLMADNTTHWVNPDDAAKQEMRVKLEVIKNLVSSPIPKSQVEADHVLKTMPILTFPQRVQTNLRLRREHWDRVNALA
jgi:hypothetical protein